MTSYQQQRRVKVDPLEVCRRLVRCQPHDGVLLLHLATFLGLHSEAYVTVKDLEKVTGWSPAFLWESLQRLMAAAFVVQLAPKLFLIDPRSFWIGPKCDRPSALSRFDEEWDKSRDEWEGHHAAS